jgi:pimeloyl-ACP methyl ester carboxylesterase
MFTKGDNTMQSKAPPRQTEQHSQETQPRRGLGAWIRRGLVWMLVGLLTLAVIGAIYQAIATQIDERTYPPPGEMVDVNGHLMHINCVGQGGPTVILETTSDGTSANWGRVQPQLSKTTRVCTYDRAGRGWSQIGPEPRDAQQIAGELHTLLLKAHVPGPYVMVGHSAGGLFVREYADLYPKEVAGMVLLDASHPDFTSVPSGREEYNFSRRVFAVTPWLAPVGIDRVAYGWGLVDLAPGLPAKQASQIRAFWSTWKQHESTRDELAVRQSRTEPQVRRSGDLGDMPLMVISSDNLPAEQAALQEELATLSTDSIHKVIEGSTHLGLVFEKEDAQVSSASIADVVEAVRNDQPLTG